MNTFLKPSTFIPKGIRVEQIQNLSLFKFTEELGNRLQNLLEKKKADLLSPDETIELATIGELDEIFSYINAEIYGTGRYLAKALKQYPPAKRDE